MGQDLDFAKEMDLELARRAVVARGVGAMGRDIRTISVDMGPPPPPPPKDPPRAKLPTMRGDMSRPGTAASAMSRPTTAASAPPNRPLPDRPKPKLRVDTSRPGTSASEAPKRPPPAKPIPVRPQAPLGMNPPTRPGTAASGQSAVSDGSKLVRSTKRLSWGSIASSRRPIKYGKGKYSKVELVPQPSDDPDDPLNWPMWKKELNYGSLLLMVALTGVMKTAFISVNDSLAVSSSHSYGAVTALTGVPLILSAFTGLASIVASRIWGKRPVYLAGLFLVFLGAIINASTSTNYGQVMAARVFQGLGWGAFDALVMGSIHDTYFEHERGVRVAIYSIVLVATTWGPPLIGGAASQTSSGFPLQFMILCVFFVFAVPAIALGAPETAFDRAYTLAQTPATAVSMAKELPRPPPSMFSKEAVLDYVTRMKPVSYVGRTDLVTLLQAPRAFIAPTTLLLFVVSFLPYCTLWALTQSLSLLFAASPFTLSPGNIGALIAGIWILSTAAVAVFSLLPAWNTDFTAKHHMGAIAGGTALAFIGTLVFGLHLDAAMAPDSNGNAATGTAVSLPALAFVLGLLGAGVYVLDATVRPLVRLSTQFTSSNLGVALRNTADMDAGVMCWRALFAGLFVLVVPACDAITWESLRGYCVGAAVGQLVVAALVGSVWWLWDEGVRRCDGKVMRLVNLEMLKRSVSFFDTD